MRQNGNQFRLITCAMWFLLLLLAIPAAVQAQDFLYTANNGTITITRYTGPGGVVDIPNMIDGLPVTSIGDYAFYDCTSLTNVTIPNSVSNIGYGAFQSCARLASITIPDSVTTIGAYAFSGCLKLTSITIPNGVTRISGGTFLNCVNLINVSIPDTVTRIESASNPPYGGPLGAFEGCFNLTTITIPHSVTYIADYTFSGSTSLTAITVDATNSIYSSVDGVLFNKSQTTIMQYPAGKAGSYTIPNSVTGIGVGAFGSCTGLTSITIPNSVTSIGSDEFAYCFNLTSVSIGNSVSSIGSLAFLSCTSLMGLCFQGNAPSLGPDVFSGDNNAIVYYLPGTTGWGSTFGGRPTMLWNPQVVTCDGSFGVKTNQFGFYIKWASGIFVVVDACTDLSDPTWSPVGTNTLTDGSSYFSDPNWTNYPARFYRLNWPGNN